MVGTALQKQVGFDEIEILEFHYILGDNPSVGAGAPIAIGNELVDRSTVDLEFYEKSRGKRKSRKKMILSVPTRAQILLEMGYSIDEIAEATLEAEVSRDARATTNLAQKWDKVNEVSERFGRVFRKALGGGPAKLTVAANTA